MRVFIKVLIAFFSLVFVGVIGWLGYLLMQDKESADEMDELRMMVKSTSTANSAYSAATADESPSLDSVPVNSTAVVSETSAADIEAGNMLNNTPGYPAGSAAEVTVSNTTSAGTPAELSAFTPASTPAPMPTPTPTPVPTPPDVLPEYQDLYNMNPDFAGWVKIDGTVIDYPVVYTPDDIEKYLYMLFNGKKSSAGVPLIGEGASLFPQSDTITIYSHNRRNGTMFAMLTEYEQPAFYEEHKLVQFDTRYERGTYEVFATCHFQFDKYDPEKYFQYYAYPTLATETEYTEFVDTIRSAALYDTGIIPEFGEKLLLLSTCGYFAENGRIVVVARRLEGAGNAISAAQ